MRYLIVLGLTLASLTGAEDPLSHLLAKAEQWYSLNATDRNIDEGRALVDQCVLEHGRILTSQNDGKIDPTLNTMLFMLAAEGPKEIDAYVVNTCDHLLLRYGDDFKRYGAILQTLYAEPSTLNFWSKDERMAHLQRRLPMLRTLWGRINAGARDAPDQLPLFSIARPMEMDPTLTAEERAQAWDRYFQDRDLNAKRAKHALRHGDFLDAKTSCIDDLQAWLRARCLPDDVEIMREFLNGAGFDENEIISMIGHPTP